MEDEKQELVDEISEQIIINDEVKSKAESLSGQKYTGGIDKREFDEKNIEKTAEICYNENNHKLKATERRFFL